MVILSFSTLILVSLLAGIGYILVDGKLASNNKKLSTSTTASIPKNNQIAQNQQTTSNLQVQGAQTLTPQTTENNLPAPQDFQIYEEFASADSVKYVDITIGEGERVAPGDTVAVIYTGWLTSGQRFDASKINEQNQIEPIVLTVGAGSVIRGWEDGLVGMQEGGQRRLIIPSEFGYGASGAGDGLIPPNAMLIFDVQITQLQKAELQGL